MPALPQFFYGTCFIRRIKVYRKLHIKHISQSNRHITITAEIKINLKGIGQDYEQSGGRIQKISLFKAEICNEGKHVG